MADDALHQPPVECFQNLIKPRLLRSRITQLCKEPQSKGFREDVNTRAIFMLETVLLGEGVLPMRLWRTLKEFQCKPEGFENPGDQKGLVGRHRKASPLQRNHPVDERRQRSPQVVRETLQKPNASQPIFPHTTSIHNWNFRHCSRGKSDRHSKVLRPLEILKKERENTLAEIRRRRKVVQRVYHSRPDGP